MTADRIVEVYSAGNIVEAQSLAEVLEEAGIVAQVVGDTLGNAAGWLPQTDTAPRVWVRQADEARAREIIAIWLRDPRAMVADGAAGESDEESPESSEAASLLDADEEDRDAPAETDEAEEPPSPEARPFRLLDRLLPIAGAASVLAGFYFASWGWLEQREFSGTAEAQYVKYRRYLGEDHPVTAVRDLPVRLPPLTYRVKYNVLYVYTVDDKRYGAELRDSAQSPEVVTVHYNPERPGEHIVGPLTPPWVSLLLGSVVGGLFFFVAWRFR